MQKSKVKHEANMQKVKDALEESYHHTPHAPHNFKEVMQELRAMQESHGPEKYVPAILDSEIDAMLKASKGNVGKAVLRARKRNDFLSALGKISIADAGPGILSDGFTAFLEGYHDREGNPLIYSEGNVFGSHTEMIRQMVYAHEQAMAEIARTDRPLRVTVIVNVRAKTFGMPDAANRKMSQQLQTHFPWVVDNQVLFVGLPKAVQFAAGAISRLCPAKIKFVEPKDLTQYVDIAQLPASLGGTSKWTPADYVAYRKRKEGVLKPLKPAIYKGKVNPIHLKYPSIAEELQDAVKGGGEKMDKLPAFTKPLVVSIITTAALVPILTRLQKIQAEHVSTESFSE